TGRRPRTPVPLRDLVPGLPPAPHHRLHRDTPDQALPPRVPVDRATREPVPPAVGEEPLVEYVPRAEAVRRQGGAAPVPCSASTGPYQREVEAFLGLPVDGVQSGKDCETIRAWQRKEGIEPAIGFAGPTSMARIRLAEARRNPNADGRCPAGTGRVVCLDLPRQIMWVQRGDRVVFGPVTIRSGKAGYATRTGWHRIYLRNRDHWSTLYRAPMPFAQFFNGGQAFHGVYGNVHDPEGGSHGCVNLTYADARRLWDVLSLGDRVYSWGRRPGT
ncbi:L,D-transpeptidase, partial [Streptomyces sp. URMC 123]|uniref:L,D-transpeptidase n=1 Tax=Streptomyces sp. URMC 123 TaxID=3423403 RepID=UPI003F1E38F7